MLPIVAAVCLRALGCGGDVLPIAADFFLDSHANGLDNFRDMFDGNCCFAGAPGPEVADCDKLEVLKLIGCLVAETAEDRLRERSELFELVVVERPLGTMASTFSWSSLR